MSELDRKFNQAAERVKTLKQKPDNRVLLNLYALYKQSTIGSINIDQPWAIQVEARAKWDAWNSLGQMEKEEAMEKYVELVNSLFQS